MDKQTAFIIGMAFAKGFAQDSQFNDETGREEKWITVHPNGKDKKGQPVLIDAESGDVQGGMGGKFNGMNIKEVSKQVPKEQRYKNVELFGGISAARRNPNAINLRTLHGLTDSQKVEKLLGVSAFKDDADRERVRKETDSARSAYRDYKKQIEEHKKNKPDMHVWVDPETDEYKEWASKYQGFSNAENKQAIRLQELIKSGVDQDDDRYTQGLAELQRIRNEIRNHEQNKPNQWKRYSGKYGRNPVKRGWSEENPEYTKWSDKFGELTKNRDDSLRKAKEGAALLNGKLYKVSVSEANKWNHKADNQPIKIADGKAARAIVDSFRGKLESIGNKSGLKTLYKAAFEKTNEEKQDEFLSREDAQYGYTAKVKTPFQRLHEHIRKKNPSVSPTDLKAILPLLWLYGNKNRKGNVFTATNPRTEVNREVADMFRKSKVTKGDFLKSVDTLRKIIGSKPQKESKVIGDALSAVGVKEY